MSEPAMLPGLSDEEFAGVLHQYWEPLACFAFASWKESGRGVVFLDRRQAEQDEKETEAGLEMGYAVFPPGKPDAQAAALIAAYDPSWEIVFQYLRPDNSVRTVHVRTAPGQRHPWRIYCFDKLLANEGKASQWLSRQ